MSLRNRFSSPMPKLSTVEAKEPYTVIVTWKEGRRLGRQDVIDLTPIIESYKIFRPLRNNPDLFRAVRKNEYGNTVLWGPEESDLELTANTLEKLAEETLTKEDFKRFLGQYRLTHAEAAAVLGRSRRTIELYLSGVPIPRVVSLACYGFVARNQGIRDLLAPTQTRVTPDQTVTVTRDTIDTRVRPASSPNQPLHEITSAG